VSLVDSAPFELHVHDLADQASEERLRITHLRLIHSSFDKEYKETIEIIGKEQN
jgi:hypothetical protein